MQGYDADKALAYIAKTVNRKPFASLGPQIEGYLRQAQELDLQFMRETDVLDADGYEGDGYYDDDEAFEYILDEMVRTRGLGEEEAMLAASLLDAYMGAHEAFLEKEGLADD